tara:strand:- start:16183 stop:16338 length:156 start_codon:yes stop_codon:yes gene_type:complete
MAKGEDKKENSSSLKLRKKAAEEMGNYFIRKNKYKKIKESQTDSGKKKSKS